MEAKEQVLDAMKKAGAPLNAGKIVELTGLDRKEVDKAMKALASYNLTKVVTHNDEKVVELI